MADIRDQHLSRTHGQMKKIIAEENKRLTQMRNQKKAHIKRGEHSLACVVGARISELERVLGILDS